jgi:hypothetical protein
MAPVFLNADNLVALANCCVGRQRMVRIGIQSGKRRAFATLSSPPVSIARLRPRLLIAVTALRELALVSQGRFRVVARSITAASG